MNTNKKFSSLPNVDSEKRVAVTTRFSDIPPELISWLWPKRIALGKLTMIAGDPGLGKGLVTVSFAAKVSKGDSWPVDNTQAPIGDVVLLSAEDDPADTIRPRLDAAGADCARVHLLRAIRVMDDGDDVGERMFSLKRDIDALGALLTKLPACKLVIIDPISAYLDGVESHKNSDVRGLLAPLADLAAQHKVAVILVQHLNKNSLGSAMYRSMGSIAFNAAARAAYMVTKDKNNPERRLVLPVKNNIAKDTTGIAYSVAETVSGQPFVEWESEPITITADEALAAGPEDKEDKFETSWAEQFLTEQLVSGPVRSDVLQSEARKEHITHKQLRRAQGKLRIIPRKSAFDGGWVWELPLHEDALNGVDAPAKSVGILGAKGHLGNIKDESKAD